MSTASLDRLDRHIDALLQSYERQRAENKSLREKQAQLISQQEALYKKHKLTVSGLKQLIGKLKTLEKSYANSESS